ncbi:hypothetical protein GF327_00935 [Candidatus Woesearchaeota archaeon]|nr:hypothetical protein [Candidatus Woesearchaeota archaeon]
MVKSMITMARKVISKGKKRKKKKWYPVLAPGIFNNMHIGETIQYDIKDAIDTPVEVNLMNLTKNIKDQNVRLKLVITGVKENALRTNVVKYELNSASIKRMVRRRRDRIDDSLQINSKDKVLIRLKPLLITRNKTKGKVKLALRKEMNKLLESFIKNNIEINIFKEVIFYKLQKKIRDKLDKIYPIRNFEIRVLKKIVEQEEKKKDPKKTDKEPMEQVTKKVEKQNAKANN